MWNVRLGPTQNAWNVVIGSCVHVFERVFPKMKKPLQGLMVIAMPAVDVWSRVEFYIQISNYLF